MLKIIFFAINNVLRGLGFRNKYINFMTSKTMTSLYSGILMGLSTMNWVIGLAIWLGLLTWAALGWGKYFAAFTGKYSMSEKEIPVIDKVTNKVFLKTLNAHAAGAVGMSLRGLMIVPMFVVLAAATGNAWAILYGFICAGLQGVCYLAPAPFYPGIVKRHDRYMVSGKNVRKPWNFSVTMAEFLMGVNIGFWVSMI